MKKRKSWLSKIVLILVFLLGSIMSISRSSADWLDPTNPLCSSSGCGIHVGEKELEDNLDPGVSSEESIISLILSWVRYFLGFVFVVAVVVLIVAGVMFIVSFGNEAQNKKAIKMITWTIIGIILIMLSYVIISAIMDAVNAA